MVIYSISARHVGRVIGAQLVTAEMHTIYFECGIWAQATHLAHSCRHPFPSTGLLAPAFLSDCYHYQEGSCNCYCSIHSFNAAFPPFLHKQPSINHLRRSLRRPTRSALQLRSLSSSPHSPSHPTRTLQLLDQSSAPLFQHYPLAVLTNPSML